LTANSELLFALRDLLTYYDRVAGNIKVPGGYTAADVKRLEKIRKLAAPPHAWHYTKNTESCRVWCNKCSRITEHRVDNGRRGPCLEHQTPVRAKIPKFDPPKSGNLFEP
jgi:hypothetical protein